MQGDDSMIRRITLSDPERLIEGIRGAEMVPCQLSHRPRISELHRIVLPTACLDLASLGPSMLFTGLMPRDCFTLVFVLSCPGKGRAFNFAAEHGDGYLGFFPPGGEIDAVTPEGYANATLTVGKRRFLDEVSRFFPEMPESVLEKGAAMRIGSPAEDGIRRLVADLRSFDEAHASRLTADPVRATLEGDLFRAFLGALRQGCGELVPRAPARVANRQRRLRELRDYLSERSGTGVGLDTLCEVSGLSARGLENLFRDHLGITPLIFLRHRRLHEARRLLLAPDGVGEPSVKRVALDLGFWHFGRFARYYHDLFGEYPVETLHSRRRF
jgi:AraC-like DNA-binding protein